ncbi:MAG: hypothetical protein A2902_04675 [Elusimicrobia bacterium RIFCSPLOWO2_01_FULL_64_13]|nr:MAG: hypothetical protein A2902_04675 [Elusimicrobia bacterium RIFCSPLOWO2_01_FULL_64_13]
MSSAAFLFPVLPPLLILVCAGRLSAWKTAALGASAAVLSAAAVAVLAPDPGTRALAGLILLANLAVLSVFLRLLGRLRRARTEEWEARDARAAALLAEEERKNSLFRTEIEDLDREVIATRKVYAAVRGLGEAFSWEEMIPHIDFAVQNCLEFRDYQLHLLDDNAGYQKVLSRGSRLPEPPADPDSKRPRWHSIHGDFYVENPICQGPEKIGFLWARATDEQAARGEAPVLEDTSEIAEELVMGLQKARLFTRLEKLSRIDGLTGVHRRQIFNERMNEEIRRARAFKSFFSLLICDLDHFKRINDTYGHQAGDEVLKRTGELLKECVYETDFVARYGGEEFVILLPQADPAGVKRKAEFMRRRLAREIFSLAWSEISVTMSVGISHFPRDGSDPSALLRAADRALYAAKEAGRNRVVDAAEMG